MILIIFVALLLFGGEKLPEIARGLGKGIRDFKDASEGVKREITNQINNYEEKKTETPIQDTETIPVQDTSHLIEEHSADETKAAGINAEAPKQISFNPVANTMPLSDIPHVAASEQIEVQDHHQQGETPGHTEPVITHEPTNK